MESWIVYHKGGEKKPHIAIGRTYQEALDLVKLPIEKLTIQKIEIPEWKKDENIDS